MFPRAISAANATTLKIIGLANVVSTYQKDTSVENVEEKNDLIAFLNLNW
jgi:hypothetical protein